MQLFSFNNCFIPTNLNEVSQSGFSFNQMPTKTKPISQLQIKKTKTLRQLAVLQKTLIQQDIIYERLLSKKYVLKMLDSFDIGYVSDYIAYYIVRNVLDYMQLCKFEEFNLSKYDYQFVFENVDMLSGKSYFQQREPDQISENAGINIIDVIKDISLIAKNWKQIKDDLQNIHKDTLKMLEYLVITQKIPHKYSHTYFQLKFDFSKEQIIKVAEAVIYMSRFDSNAFCFFSNYLYRSCYNKQKELKSNQINKKDSKLNNKFNQAEQLNFNVQKIQDKMPQKNNLIIEQIEEILIQSYQIVKQFFSILDVLLKQKNNDQISQQHINFKQNKLQTYISVISLKNIAKKQKIKAIKDYIEIKVEKAKQDYNIFYYLVERECSKYGYHFQTDLKIKNMDQKKAVDRVIQKISKKYMNKDEEPKQNHPNLTMEQLIKHQKQNYEQQLTDIVDFIPDQIQYNISDLVRAKCIFTTVSKINQCCHAIKQKIKQHRHILVEVDNRLFGKKGTYDLVIKVKVGETVCQLQLVLNHNIAAYNFNHKVYELERNQFKSPIIHLKEFNQEISSNFLGKISAIIQQNLNAKFKINYQSHINFTSIKDIFQKLLDLFPPMSLQLNNFKNQSKQLVELKEQLQIHLAKQSSINNKEVEYHRSSFNYVFLNEICNYEQCCLLLDNKIYSFLNKIKIVVKNKKQEELSINQYKLIKRHCNTVRFAIQDHFKKSKNLKYAELKYKQLSQVMLSVGDKEEAKCLLYEYEGMMFQIEDNLPKLAKYWIWKLQNNRIPPISTVNSVNEQIGYCYLKMKDIDQALKYFTINQLIFSKFDDTMQKANNFTHLGEVYIAKQNQITALEYYKRAEEILDHINQTNSMNYSEVLIGIGVILKNQGKNENALPLFLRSIQIFKSYGELYKLYILEIQRLVGQVLHDLNRNRQAIELFQRLIAMIESQQIKQTLQHNIIYFNLGECYSSEQCYDLALKNYQQSIDVVMKQFKYNIIIWDRFQKMGQIYLSQKKYTQALICFTRALDYQIENKGQSIICADIYSQIGIMHLKLHKLKEAIYNSNKILQIIRRLQCDMQKRSLNLFTSLIKYILKNEQDNETKSFLDNIKNICQQIGWNIYDQKYKICYVLYVQTLFGFAQFYVKLKQFKEALNFYQNLKLISFNQQRVKTGIQKCKRKLKIN